MTTTVTLKKKPSPVTIKDRLSRVENSTTQGQTERILRSNDVSDKSFTTSTTSSFVHVQIARILNQCFIDQKIMWTVFVDFFSCLFCRRGVSNRHQVIFRLFRVMLLGNTPYISK